MKLATIATLLAAGLALASPARADGTVKSALLETLAASAAIEIDPQTGAGFKYALSLSPNKKLKETWYLVAEFTPKADPASAVTVRLTAKPGEKRFMIFSDSQPMWLLGDYTVVVRVYADAEGKTLLGTHEQPVPLPIDRRALEAAGISFERPKSAPLSAPAAVTASAPASASASAPASH